MCLDVGAVPSHHSCTGNFFELYGKCKFPLFAGLLLRFPLKGLQCLILDPAGIIRSWLLIFRKGVMDPKMSLAFTVVWGHRCSVTP